MLTLHMFRLQSRRLLCRITDDSMLTVLQGVVSFFGTGQSRDIILSYGSIEGSRFYLKAYFEEEFSLEQSDQNRIVANFVRQFHHFLKILRISSRQTSLIKLAFVSKNYTKLQSFDTFNKLNGWHAAYPPCPQFNDLTLPVSKCKTLYLTFRRNKTKTRHIICTELQFTYWPPITLLIFRAARNPIYTCTE